jgi:light-regulated signal transduction histidine kinase (bacteriophytochrome)
LSAIDAGEGIIVAAAIRDMTAELLVKDLERSNHDLESFIYSVAHDLRAPLRALSGYSELLLEDYGEVLGEEGHGYAERIVSASEQMGQQIDYLLHLSRISRAELHLQSVDLGLEAARIAEEIQRRDPIRHICFTIQRQVLVLADRRLIRTVLQNLLDNAWKFTVGRDDASIEFGTVPSSDASVCCYVRDNGVGFDPAYASKLFQPFQRLHAARDFPGTGTGLATVRRIVERHGGHVWAEGAVGAGATFYFTLDRKESA